jgi:peptidoglycan hydrolase-like protein with peptidoglycan-binding domain
MDKILTGAVGHGGSNHAKDVRIVQELLNKVPVSWGGPAVPLDVDGLVGEKTKAAIRTFQQNQLSTFFAPDGRVDPHKRTIGRLNHIAQTSEQPGGILHISVEPISHMVQPTNMVCWAAAGTMLISARDQMSYTINAAMQKADSADPGYGYLNKFNTNQGLPPSDTGRYTRALRLQVGPAASFTVLGWRTLMSAHGAIGVVGLSPFLHIRVITEMHGDGSVFGTHFTVHDPGTPITYKELFINFAERYEAAADIDHRMDQIWHK